MNASVVTRSLAKLAGATKYFTGKRCKRGHIAERTTSNGDCVVCSKARSIAFDQSNPDSARAKHTRYYARHSQRVRAEKSAYRASNPEKIRATKAASYNKHQVQRRADRVAYYAANPEKGRAYSLAWLAANPLKHRAQQAARKAAKDSRTPDWADLHAIRQFYEDCPDGFVVDHVLPLRGGLISGLHVLGNLQYLTNVENCSKHNRFAPYSESFDP